MIAAHDTDIDYTFYNDRVKEIIPDADVQEPFTYVPIVAGHMELVGGNALVFGNITEGYDVINPKVSVAISYEDISGELPRVSLSVSLLQIGDEPIIYDGAVPYNNIATYYEGDIVYVVTPTLFYQCTHTVSGVKPGAVGGDPTWPLYWTSIAANFVHSIRTVTAQIVITLPLTVKEGDFYYITIINENRSFNFTAEYEVLAGNTYADVKTGLENDLLANGLDPTDIIAGGDPNKIYLFQTPRTFLNSPTFEATDLLKVFLDYNPLPTAFYLAEGDVKLHPALKVGASHGFGIVYKDRSGRTCSVMKTDDMTVYIPFYSDETDSNLDTLVTLTFIITHAPPSWAETYEIVYFGNLSMDYFLQVRADNITTLGADRYAVNIQQTLEDTWNNNNRWRVGAYEWQSGDRMRLVGTINEDTGVVTKFSTLYDYEIEERGTQHGEEIDGDWLMIQAVEGPDYFGNKSQVVNVDGDLTGTVVETVPFADTVTRKDTITLAGTGGHAYVYCGGLAILATFNATPTQTATDFASVANVAAFLARGIILTTAGPDLIFEMNVDSVDFPSQTNIIVEIYRPRKGLGKTVAYGTGMVFDIATDENGYRYHKGDTDQVFNAAGVCTSGAEVTNTANDCWKFIRLNFKWNTTSIMPFYAESYYPSDWWDNLTASNRLTSSGFPFLDDLSQRQTVLPERLRHGGFIITGTRTNNIAHFTYEDFLDLPKKNGQITALREVGYTLKVLQLHKETSIYINRIENFNADGTQNFTLTDAFFGTTRPMEDDFGCQHPNSVMVNNRNMYYWDNSEGELIRSAPNGQLALSGPEYKMSRWFKELVKWIKASGGKELLNINIGANNEYDEVWITFRMDTEIKGIIFSEKNGRFTSRIDQITESYLHLGNFFAHLYHQRLWIMNTDENQDYLTWVGVPTSALLETVSNVEPSKNKVFTSIALFADHEMQSLEKYVRVPAEASGVNLVMETNVPVWDRREGVFFGEIMKDVNSKGVFTGLYDKKLNGNSIRGRYCFVKFKTEEHDEKVRIDSIVIFSTPSERNVK
jgi:hypothetical protein